MSFSFKLCYAKTRENTDLAVEINSEDSESQNNQSPRGWLGLVKDYLPLAISVAGLVLPFFGIPFPIA
ncbi:hypothetical protein [Shewanella sp. MBTL60-007]|uniref:hypothetical protein n=1 Tax=Shewanella sp. MBTL60-007 TaxID=2815911 RepID=UPI001BBEF55A|nr:hypothetical protein [Shewanella sp. MBTL60-007]GIU12508.1 hypothetical protein TUM3792_01140 [Shewanella sp. MBTL60-007]